MTVLSVPDTKKRYFEFKTLSKCHGQVEKILTIYKQLKRNAQCVPTTFGGGFYGYLAVVLRNLTHTTIPGAVAFVEPTDPGPFCTNTKSNTPRNQS